MADVLATKVHSGLLSGDLTVGLDHIEFCGRSWYSMTVERIKSLGNRSKSLQLILRYTGRRTSEFFKVSIDLKKVDNEIYVTIETPYPGYRKIECGSEKAFCGYLENHSLDLRNVIGEARSYLRVM